VFGPGLPPIGITPNDLLQLRGPRAPQLPTMQQPAMPTWRDRLRTGTARVFGVPAGLLSDDIESQAVGSGISGLAQGLLEASGPVVGGPAPSMGQALARGLQRGREAAGGAVQNGLLVDDRRRQLAQLQARQRVAQMFPISPTDSREQQIHKLRGMMTALVQMGDMEGAGKIGEYLKSADNDSNTVRAPQEIRLGNEVVLRDPVSGREVGRYPIQPGPKDPNAPDHARQLAEQRMFQREQQLEDDFNKDTKAQREAAFKLSEALSEAPAARSGDGAAQINMLYAFVSGMDPNSAVREGEIGLARAAAPFYAQAMSLIQKYTTDGSVVVPPQLIDKMAELMQRRVGGYQRYVRERSSYYGKRAQRWGLKTDGLFPEINFTAPTAESGRNRLLDK
jgi:hypothetical protein